MKIAVIGAAGKAGSLILKEAIARGHNVAAIVRDASKLSTPGIVVVEKEIADLTYADLAEYDVIIDAFGTWAPESLPLHQTTLKHLADLLSDHPNRLLVVGGAGSLYTDPSHTMRLMDAPDFPEAFRPLAASMAKAFDALRTRSDVNWTYLSPAAAFEADGPRTGHYISGQDELLRNAQGESRISYADYAIAMVDEAEAARHIKARFTVCS